MEQTNVINQVRRILVIGKQGVGKTTLAKQIISWVKVPSINVIVPDGFDVAWDEYPIQTSEQINEPGKRRILFGDEGEKDLLSRLGGAFNALTVFDDCLPLLTDPLKLKQVEQLLVRSRQKGNYYIFILHGVAPVPANFWNYFSDIILFKTLDKMERNKRKIPDYDNIEKVRLAVEADPDNRAYFWYKRT